MITEREKKFTGTRGLLPNIEINTVGDLANILYQYSPIGLGQQAIAPQMNVDFNRTQVKSIGDLALYVTQPLTMIYPAVGMESIRDVPIIGNIMTATEEAGLVKSYELMESPQLREWGKVASGLIGGGIGFVAGGVTGAGIGMAIGGSIWQGEVEKYKTNLAKMDLNAQGEQIDKDLEVLKQKRLTAIGDQQKIIDGQITELNKMKTVVNLKKTALVGLVGLGGFLFFTS